jgi:hypothetical protein
MSVRVAITGTLSRPRKEIVEQINATSNGEFAPSVTYDTNYLVASRFDTEKAKTAAQIGVTVISEKELMEFIQQGSFPQNRTPIRPPRPAPDFRTDEIKWKERYAPERLCFLEYCDNEGTVTQRFVLLSRKGIGSNGHEYLGAFDHEVFKTFRAARVRKIEELQPQDV